VCARDERTVCCRLPRAAHPLDCPGGAGRREGRIIREPQMQEQFIGLGVEPLGTTPGEAGSHVRKEIALWTQVVQRHHIRAD